jgi:hypothetical protein
VQPYDVRNERHLHLGATLRLIASLLVLAACGAASAGEILVTVVRHGALPVSDTTLLLRKINVVEDADRVEPAAKLVVPANVNNARIEVADGSWAIDVDGGAAWHTRQFVTAPSTVIVDLWERATVAGQIDSAETTLPKALVIHYEASTRSDALPADGDVVCAIASRAFRCDIPAGAWKLRAKAASMIERYFPSATFTSEMTKSLGVVRLQRGQSIRGRVDIARIDGNVTKVIVSAVPTGGHAALTAHPSANGAFHIDAVAPGEYNVSATRGNEAMSPEAAIVVHHGADADLARPLIVGRPAEVTVIVAPRLDPDGRPWNVTLDHYATERFIDTTATLTTTNDATWHAQVPPARYELRVTSESGASWHSETLDIAGTTTIPLLIATRKAHGRVTLGDAPLHAALSFSAKNADGIEATSGEDGTFEVLLPRGDGELRVQVKSDKPAVDRTLSVSLGDSDDATCNIALPSSIIHGKVVDAIGAPVEHALINIMGGAGTDFVQPETTADGTFAIHGLAAGKYRLQSTAFMQESSVVELDVRENDAPEPLLLTMAQLKQVRGRIASAFGPVAGARVTVLPTGVAFLSRSIPETDESGAFVATIPVNATSFDVQVAAPGFAFSWGHLPYRDKVLLITVDQRGGRLLLEGAKPDEIYLLHEGTRMRLDWFASSWQLEQDGSRSVVPMLEPGVYALCSGTAPNERCASGFLPPYGTLTLSAAK